jgi:hypothetical protein
MCAAPATRVSPLRVDGGVAITKKKTAARESRRFVFGLR